MNQNSIYWKWLCLFFLVAGCSAPRNLIHSGKTTNKGKFVLGANSSYNLPTETIKNMYGSLEDAIEKTIKQDSIVWDSSFNKQLQTMAIYSIDPVAAGFDFYLRYGILKNWDIGYAWASGVHVLDSRYQFLNKGDYFYGSIGLQYSSQSYELPSFLGKLQKLLDYELKRKDILIPLFFSNSFGKKEQYGSIAYGFVLGRTWIKYDYNTSSLYELVSGSLQQINDVPQGNTSYNTYGLSTNLKLGYKPIYGLLGLSLYYQNYGQYNLFKDEYVKFSGITIVPNLGLQLSF